MALIDITGGMSTTSNLVQPAVGGDSRTAPLPDAFVSSAVAQKLDADLYGAAETGDNSEGVASSGNLNHALLQAQQNDLLAGSGGDSAMVHDVTLGSLAAGLSAGYGGIAGVTHQATNAPASPVITESTSGSAIVHNSASALNLAPAAPPHQGMSVPDYPTPTQSVHFDAPSPAATGGGAASAGPAGANGINGTNGTNGADGTNGSNGSNGSNGHTGGETGGCCPATIIDIDIIGPIIVGGPSTGEPVTNIITNITNNVTNTVENVTTTVVENVTHITTNLTEAVENVTNTLTQTVENVTNTLTETVENITTVLPDIITTTVSTVTNILNPLLDPPPAGGDTDLLVDLGVADLPLLNETLHVGLDLVEQVIGDVDVNVGIDGILQGDSTTVSLGGELLGTALPDITISLPVTVEEIVQDPVGSLGEIVACLPDTLEGLAGGLTEGLAGGSLLSPPAAGEDTDLLADLGVADLPLLNDVFHVGLDPVEQIIGDVDVNVGIDGILQGDSSTVSLGGELLGTALPDITISLPVTVEEIVQDPVGSLGEIVACLPDTLGGLAGGLAGGLTEGLAGGSLLSPPAAGEDTDLLADLGVADLPLLNDVLHVGLDPVEQVIGDVDVNVGIDGILQGDSTTVSLGGEALGIVIPDISVTLPTTVEAIVNDPLCEVQEVVATLPETITATLDSVTDALGGGLLGAPQDGSDTDLTVNLGIIDGIHIPLDVVESITGDIDIDVTAALDALTDPACLPDMLGNLVNLDAGGDSAAGAALGAVTDVVGGLTGGLLGGGSDSAAWPATPVADLGDTLVDSVLGGGSGGGILDPVGSITEGLGLLDLGGGGSGGGLLGGIGGGLGGSLGGGKGGLFGGLFG